MKKIAIVYDGLINDQVRSLDQELSINNDVTVLKEDDLSSLSSSEKANIIDEIFSRLLKLGEFKTNTGNLRQLLKHDKISWLYYHRFKLFFETQQTYLFRLEIEHLANEYDEVIAFSNRDIFLETAKNVVFKKLKKGKSVLFSQINFLYFFIAFLRFLMSAFQIASVKKCRGMVIEDPKHNQRILKDDLKYGVANRFFYIYLDKVNNHLILDHLAIQKSQSFKFSKSLFRFASPNHKRLFSEWIIGSYLLNPFNWELILNQYKKHKSLKEAIRKHSDSTSNILDKMMLDVLKRNTLSSFYFNLKYNAYKHFFEFQRIKVVLSVDENSPNNRAVLDAAKFHSVYTIAYQHGIMYRFHPNYAYHKNDFEYSIVPDLTLVWDEYWSRFLLEKSHYPEGSVKVIGQIRKDNLQTLIESDLVKAKRQEYSFRNIILFASQPLRDKKVVHQVLSGLVQVCSDLTDTLLIFRLHPLNDTSQIFEEFAEKYNYKNFLIDNLTDLYVSLAVSDVVVTISSTVGIEAKSFGKPLIAFDPLGQDPLGLSENGLGKLCQNAETLKQELLNVLDSKINSSKGIVHKQEFKAVDKLVNEMNNRL